MSTPAFTLLRLLAGCLLNVLAVCVGLVYWLYLHDGKTGITCAVSLGLAGWCLLPDMQLVKRIIKAMDSGRWD